MDYELNSNSWENDIDDPVNGYPVGMAGGGAGGGALKEVTNRGSLCSNRNSHPLTEREVEQGLQSLEGHKGEGEEEYSGRTFDFDFIPIHFSVISIHVAKSSIICGMASG